MSPTAIPAASRALGDFSRNRRGSAVSSAAKDCAPAHPSRITADQLQQIADRLTEQDFQALSFVASSRLASGKQLARGVWMADRDTEPSRARIARRAIKRLSDWRVIDPLPGRTVGGLHGGSDTIVYGVGAAGVRLLAVRGQHQSRLGTPGARYVAHTLAATQLVVDLRIATARGELELIEAPQTEPACWRSFLAGMGASLSCKPDLFVRVAAPGSRYESRWMIEVDMATEASATIRAKARRHVDYFRSGSEPVHPRVLWAVPDRRRADQVESALTGLPTDVERLFAVCLQTHVVKRLISEARS
jgi:protein involved in plasmid replication-relaxation